MAEAAGLANPTESTEGGQTTQETKGADMTTQETKGAETTTQGTKGADTTTQETKAVAPEKYEAFKLPEGATFDGQPLETFSALAKEAGLSQELAQKFVDMHLGFLGQQQEGYLAAMQEQEKTWGAELLNDPEIGGAKHEQSVATANRVLKTFDKDGSLFKLISDAMLTKNPTIMKFMVRVGQAIGDDQLVDGKTPKVLPKDQPAYIGVYGSGSPLKS